MTTTEKTPGGGEFPTAAFAKHLAELGVKASDAQLVTIAATGLGDGLPDSVPTIWDRNGQKLTAVKTLIEDYRQHPERRTGTAKVLTLRAFIDLTKRHMDKDSAVFANSDWRKPSLTAVIDYHRQAEPPKEGAAGDGYHQPRWLKHKLVYEFPLSEPWQKWVEGDGKVMDQADFAEFIEDHIAELSAPTEREQKEYEDLFRTKIADPAEVVTLSRGLAVTVGAKVGRAVNLQSGEGELVFEEVHTNGGGQKLTVPGLFMLSLPVFFRGANVRIPVRLRYRVANGAVRWAYQIWRPDTFVTDAVLRDLDAVRVETGLPAYEGAAEA